MTDILNENTESCAVSDTPETDAICKEYLESYGGAIPVKFAQKLERERDEARSDLAFRRDLYKLQEERVKELEAEVKLWKENATSNKDTFNFMVQERDDWKSFAVKLENAFKIENDALRKQLSIVDKQNIKHLTLLQEHGLAEYGN